MKWEYKVIQDQEAIDEERNKKFIEKFGEMLSNRHLTIDKLNLLGDDGWELVTYRPESDSKRAVAIFKRPKNQV